jgi:hypothetical protein
LNASEEEKVMLREIKRTLETHFASYQYVDHRLLLSNHVWGSCPEGHEPLDSEGKPYSLIYYLFGFHGKDIPDRKNVFP